MAKVKGLKKINKIINNFTQTNFNIKAKIGSDFLAFTDKMEIRYAVGVDSDDVKYFITDAISKYQGIKADPFIWLLLHEIGHCMTNDMFTPDETEYFEQMKEKLAYIRDDQDRNDWYHCLPDEFMATGWAARYMFNHGNKVAKFWNKLQPALIQFYMKNGVDIREEGAINENA